MEEELNKIREEIKRLGNSLSSLPSVLVKETRSKIDFLKAKEADLLKKIDYATLHGDEIKAGQDAELTAEESKSKTKKILLIGGIVGGVVLATLIIGVVIYKRS